MTLHHKKGTIGEATVRQNTPGLAATGRNRHQAVKSIYKSRVCNEGIQELNKLLTVGKAIKGSKRDRHASSGEKHNKHGENSI